MDERLQEARALLAAADVSVAANDRCREALHAAAVAADVLLGRRSTRSGDWGEVLRRRPELGEWAAYFDAATGRLNLASRAGVSVGLREADDVLRGAEGFCDEVVRRLGDRRCRVVGG